MVTPRAAGTLCLPLHPPTGPVPDVYSPTCPSRLVLDRIGARWTTLVTGALSPGPRRYGELRRDIPGISEKMLAQTLRQLERDGMVERTVRDAMPPMYVDYRLTPLGRELEVLHQHLRGWAEAHVREILAAQQAYDAPTHPAGVGSVSSPADRRPTHEGVG